MTVSDTTILKEYEQLIDHFGFTLPEIATIIMNGVKAAFLEDEEKLLLIEQFESEFTALGVGV
jgi:adenosine deaminase